MKAWKNCPNDDKCFKVISTALQSKPQLLDFIFDPLVPRVNFTRQTLPGALDGLSHGEKILVRVALDFWNSTGDATLWEIIEVLGRQDQINLIDALCLKEIYNLKIPDRLKEQIFW